MRHGRRSQAIQAIATLQHRHYAPAGMTFGDSHHCLREVGEIPVGEGEAAQKVSNP
jgi:hypothetical protein